MSKCPHDLAKERLARVEAAINLQEPDRVPFAGIGGDIIPAYSGITSQEFCFDYEKARKALAKYNEDFPFDWNFGAGILGVAVPPLMFAFTDDPDIFLTTAMYGTFHDILGDTCTRYPGRETGVNCSPQFIGGTYMGVEEYDDLIADPIGFNFEVMLPRVCKNLRTPRQAAATWVRMGMESMKFAHFMQGVGEDMAKIGIPFLPITMGMSPLDVIADGYRNFTNVMLDLRRHPEKVKKACEAMVEPILKVGLGPKDMGVKVAFIPLHLNEYLSPELYSEFYWPYLKEVILGFAKEGIKSLVFFEGKHEPHLETILDLPAGWGVAYFEKTDVVKAKEVLKDHTCIMGGVPVSLIVTGTPHSIDAYVKDLLEKMKPGGGFILSPSVGNAPRGTPVENIRALIEAVEKYG